LQTNITTSPFAPRTDASEDAAVDAGQVERRC
jgi:hypothetical protein